MHPEEEPIEPTISGRILERFCMEDRMDSVLAARPPQETTLEVVLAQQLARLPNGEAVLQAIAFEFDSRIRYRLPKGEPGSGRTDLESQLLATSARFFQRVAMRRAKMLRAGESGLNPVAVTQVGPAPRFDR